MAHISKKKIVFILFACFFLCIGGFLVWASVIKLPDLSNFEARKIANSSKITDRTGEIVLYDINQGVRRTEIPLDQMGQNIVHAVISVEDVHFYEHNGIRPTSFLRAVFVNIMNGSFSQGGSTITQQIIKNTLLNTDKTVTRKFKELILALKLERQFTKDEILQIYLNDAPLGGTIYGVEEASKAYFEKSAKDLSVSEAAYLAAMFPAPSYYSPYGSHKKELNDRKNLVLRKMKDAGYLSDADLQTAQVAEVTFTTQTPNSIKAPHFVFYILDYLQKKYGQDVMESGGFTIKTTLDYGMQQKAEEIVKKNALANEKANNAENSALVALDPKTGQILTMVGSRDYFDKTIDGAFNVSIAKRQPGSSFKPFVYAAAFAKGYTPETILFDVPTEFSTNCTASLQPLPGFKETDCYHPSNFDDKFKGPISLRSALAESRNVPSVKTLYLVGLDDALATAKSLGITTLKGRDNYGLSLVLGGGEVTLLDMTSAYSVFANEGIRNNPVGILEIKDQKGTVVEKFEENSTQVMDGNAVNILNDVLSDTQARVPTFGSSITIPGVAVKTGTTNDNRDAWIMGYTPDIVVGVWSGNNNNTPMKKGGSAISGPTMMEFLKAILPNTPKTTFQKPILDADYSSLKPVLRGEWMGNESIYIDKQTGLRATENTPIEARVEKIITNVQDILFWVDRSNPRGPAPSDPSRDPQFHLWNPPVQTWWMQHAANYQIITGDTLPSGTTTDDRPVPELEISGLPNTLTKTAKPQLKITDKNSSSILSTVTIYIDDIYITTLSNPFTFTLSPEEYGLSSGTHTLNLQATNTVYGKSILSESFVLSE